MAQLPLTNVITVSASAAQVAANEYNTSNLAIFTTEQPLAAVETIAFSGVAAFGTFELVFNGDATAAINYNDPVATIQSKIQAVTGQSNVTVSGSISGQLLTLTQAGINGPIPLATVTSNSLETSGSVAITVTAAVTSSGWSGGDLGYSEYLYPTPVSTDFGSSSRTAQMANAIFSQQPNILANDGELIVIPMEVTIQTLAFSGVAASGTFEITSNNGSTVAINWNDPPSTIQSKLQAVTGQGAWIVSGSIAGESLVITCYNTYGAVSLFTISSNSLETSGSGSISVTPTVTQTGETIAAAITRTQGLVQYFGILSNVTCAVIGQTGLLAAAAVIQALNAIGVFVSFNSADIESGGMLDLLAMGSFTQTRGLYYGDSSSGGINAVLYAAGYAGRAFSTNFNGSNTTSTMHLKQLATINPDPTMTQAILTLALAAGADTYVSLQGVPGVFCSGANSYFDQVYNLQWFVGALQIAGFDYLAQSSTKIPQTESGMDGLKAAYAAVCQQGVANQYLAPGTWNSSTTFGNPALLIANIAQAGYYIYSSPIATQLQSARAARQAPLVQIAAQQAGAIQSSSVIIYVAA